MGWETRLAESIERENAEAARFLKDINIVFVCIYFKGIITKEQIISSTGKQLF